MTPSSHKEEGITIGPFNREPSQFIFHAGDDNGEMLRITKDGFYIKGEKVEDTHKIYERFHEWLKQHGY